MRRFGIFIFVFTLLAAAIGPIMAQSINVTINGAPVRFTGTQPMVVQGRALVPLRGVLEQMGAFVGWDPATHTVFAQNSETDVQLPIGSRTATVNGGMVNLDVPAQIIGGSTMVPLRFLSEALGSDIVWNNATRTVMITTDSSTAPPLTDPGTVDITSFIQNSKGWLKAGSILEVVMEATSGGVATFEIPGVVDRVAMREVSPGRYNGSWTVPAGQNLAVSDGSVIGQLRVGDTQRLIQAGNPISIDTVVPRITNKTPEMNSAVAAVRPNISVVSEDSGSGVDPTQVRISVNGVDVTDQATITRNFTTYRPQQSLQTGKNTAAVSISDRAGNSASQTWTFNVQGAGKIITSFTHSNISNLQPGDVITANITGQPNGEVSFSIISPTGHPLVTQTMQETSSGVYQGQYTVRKGQDLNGATISGTLKVASGQTYTVPSEGSITVPTGEADSAPIITAPAAGKAIVSPLVITGTAPPNSSVHLRVEYSTTILGIFETTGELSDQTVDVDSLGKFKSSPIKLTTLIKDKNTQYTITATTVSANGEESEATTVTVNGG
ncbi:MAG: copper amine oxidase N-terminal domain-containing protein [Armatimonadetes bacterium]|nr:copper amine oxidase N-terminal domain-containing protein [Armatimonadota bacterium]